MSTDKVCARQFCGHLEDEHTDADGCTRRVYGEVTPTPCSCMAFLAWSETPSESPETHETPDDAVIPQAIVRRSPERERMPETRTAVTKVFRLRHQHKDGSNDVMKLYFTAGLYDDGRVGEVFIKADKVGTLASGALDAVSIYLSMLLQLGMPLERVIEKIRGTRFPPSGFTRDSDVPNCTSPLDLLARWLEHKFLPKENP